MKKPDDQSTNKANSVCSKCGRKSPDGASGSITQWLIVCNCGYVDTPNNGGDVSFCSTCGKRASGGRAGSLTQWIFRSDLCRCAKTDLRPPPAASILEQVDQPIEVVNKDNLPFAERYQKIRELGFGGAGRVVLYFDNLLKKQVAVKRSIELTPKLAMEFQNEARALSRLKHPNIVDILDFGADDGHPYIVMTFIEGKSLTQHIEEHGPLSETIAVPLFIKLADALSHSHRAGILHRDIKSSNVILTGSAVSQDAVLIDFGIASMSRSAAKTEGIAGTPAYMSPEQFSGNKYDTRSEIYSLGCMLFEALSGRPPFIGETALQTISLHANAAVPPLPVSAIDVRLESIILKALEKDPDKRFQTALQLKEALRELVETDSSSPQNIEPIAPEKQTAKNGAPYALPFTIAATLVLTAACFGFYTLVQEKPEQDLKPKSNSNLVAFLEVDGIDSRFERSIGRSKTDPANNVLEKIYAFNTAVAGNNTEAKEEAELQLVEVQKLCKDDSRSNAAILTALAAYRRQTKRYAEGLKMAKEALRIYDLNPPPHSRLCEAYSEVACIYQQQGDKKEAQKYFNRAVQLVKESPKETHSQLLLMDLTFQNAMDTGDFNSAELIPPVLETLIATGACKPADVWQRFISFSEMAERNKYYKLEEDLLSRAAQAIPAETSSAHRFEFFVRLGKARIRLTQYHAALKAGQEAEKYMENIPVRLGGVAGLYNEIAYHLRLNKEMKEALELYEHSLQLCDRGPGKISQPAVSTLIQLADAYSYKPDWDKSTRLLAMAYSRAKKNKHDDMSSLIGGIEERIGKRGMTIQQLIDLR